MLTVNEFGALQSHLHEPEARGQAIPKMGHRHRPAGDSQDRQLPGTRGGYIGLKGDEVDYERWLLERALIDAQIIAIEMQRIGVHFLQQMTDDPEMGEARSTQNLNEFHDAVRDNMQRAITFLDRARPGTRWTRTKQ